MEKQSSNRIQLVTVGSSFGCCSRTVQRKVRQYDFFAFKLNRWLVFKQVEEEIKKPKFYQLQFDL